MTKKIIALLLALVMVIGVFAACSSGSSSGGSSSSAPAAGGTTSKDDSSSESTGGETGGGSATSDAKLTLWTYGWETASSDKIVEDTAAYKEATGVTVEVIPLASDNYSTKMSATLAGGDNPDLAFIDAGTDSLQLSARGKLLALKQYGVEQYKDLFYENVWETMTYGDDVYGLRITANNLALYYNKELFANAGVEEPTADWTWDDLRAAAKATTDEAAGVFGLDLPIYGTTAGYCWTWLPFLWQNGGTMLNEDRTEALFNSPEGVEALEFWKTMVQEDKSCPLQAAPTGVNRFTSGLVAMSIDGPWSLSVFMGDPEFKDKFGVAPLPAQKQHATIVGGEGVVAFSNTKYPQEAYDYLIHLCCSDFTQVFWENWITIPPQPEFKDFYKDNEMGPYLQVFSDQMEYAMGRQFTVTWPQIENALSLDLQAYMFDQEDDAQAALDQAAADVNELLKEG